MELSRKEFNIVQLVEDKDDYIVTESLYIFGISFSYTFYGNDGMAGIVPFHYLSSAEEKLEELEQIEEAEGKFRNGSIMLFLIFLAVVLFGVYKLIF